MLAGVLFNNRRHADERNVAVAPSVYQWASGTHALSSLKISVTQFCIHDGEVDDDDNEEEESTNTLVQKIEK